MRLRSMSTGLAGVLGVLLLTACDTGYRATGPRDLKVTHVADAPVEVVTRNGAVAIYGDSSVSDVQIHAKLTLVGSSQAEADKRLADASIRAVRQPDKTLLVEPIFPEPLQQWGDGAAFTIRLPDASSIKIATSNGTITVENLSGTLVAKSSNGAVKISNHDGEAAIDTSNGRITVNGLNGPLVAETSNGRVEASNIGGSARIETSNGRVTVSLARDQSGPVHIDTSNGDVSLTVGPAFRGAITFESSNGDATIIDPANRIRSQSIDDEDGRIVIGDGGESSVIDTSNGDITIHVSE